LSRVVPLTRYTYPLSLHDALPICNRLDQALTRLDQLLAMQPDNYPLLEAKANMLLRKQDYPGAEQVTDRLARLRSDDPDVTAQRSEEHTSELQSRENLVCRLLLDK